MSTPRRGLSLDHTRLPWAARAANVAGLLLGKGALAPAKLSEESLLAEARRIAKRPQGDAGAFTTALRTLLASIDAEAGLSLVGRVAVRQTLVRNLSNAMRIDAELERDPGIAQQPIPRPIFIAGFPRTGTTLLHQLLALLPGVRVPRMWELMQPAPPPRPDAAGEDPRVADAEKAIRGLEYLVPHIKAIHPFDARAPEECLHLFENAFMSSSVGFYLQIPGFIGWLSDADMAPAYARYRLQLQLLQRHSPGAPWVLKWPGHLTHLDVLFQTFPDAGIVHTHRSLDEVAGSSCSYSATLRRLYTDRVDPMAIGENWMQGSRVFIDRAMAARGRLGPSSFFDLKYQDLLADPVGSVRRVCERFAIPVTPAAEDRMREHLRANAADKHGRHRYTLEQFGLDRAGVTRAFADYHEHFGVTAGR